VKTLFTLCVTFFCFSTAALSQGVAINENGTPRHSSAILDVSSTQKGFLPPRMTTAQRDSVRNPADGLVIFNLTTGCLDYFFDGSWYEWCGAITYPEGTIHCTDVPTAVVDVINPATGKTWMDRNLGASRAATSSNDSAAYGDLYQWGRRADGHQCRNSATTTTLSSTDKPVHGNFILAPGSPFDWRSPQNDNLWQGVNGDNNPCPSGYRIPTTAELSAERASWATQNIAGAFASPLKLPKAGTRYANGSVNYGDSTIGLYWTSLLVLQNVSTLFFNSSFSMIISNPRAGGASVRCIKEAVITPGSISELDCQNATSTGTLTQGEVANGVSSSVPYTGGNGGSHAGQTVASTGVAGLTATLAEGNFTNAVGTLLYNISGTPSTSGTASFALNIGGLTCTLTRLVNAAGPTYPAGTVHCTPNPTAVTEVVNPATGKTWMDRNLGATRAAANSTDADAFGDLYLWGRRADGHQCRNSATTSTISSTPQPAHGNFITTPNSPPWDWLIPQNNDLWQGQNGMNNPCPTGYRVPTEAELNAERTSWVSQNSTGAFASPLKFTMAGVRSNDGSLQWVGSYGYYWTSTLTEFNNPSLLYISSGGAFMNVLNRNTGYSVRCIKEDAPIQGSISSLDCSTAALAGTLTQGVAASGVSSTIPYTGGNGGTHAGQTVASTGITGLTATLAAGSFANGSGTLLYTITGTPANSGTASFALNIGGKSCTLTRSVNALTGPAYPAGTVHCNPTPTAVVDVVNPATGRTWMDRNLGASQVATSSSDAAAYGDLYQWGRFADGHQCRNSDTTSVLSSVSRPPHGKFIISQNDPYSWRTSLNNNAWQGVNGVNNPCPAGYRLPTSAEFQNELFTWPLGNAEDAFSSPLKLSVAGYRVTTNGVKELVGSQGLYWTSTVMGKNAAYMNFEEGIAGIPQNPRAFGYSVRCIKEQPL